MRTDADCTVYEAGTLAHRVIRGVHWEDCKGVVRRKAGAQAADSAVVYIPLASTEAPPKAGDYLVRGAVEIDYATAKELLMAQDTRRVLSVDARDYGSPALRHWEVAAN